MNLLKSPLRRAAAIAAGTLIGLGGVLVAAGPASAHHPDLEGKARCSDKGWRIDWKLWPVGAQSRGVISGVVSTSGSPLKEIVEGKGIGRNDTIKDFQRFDASVKTTTLTVYVTWPKINETKSISKTVTAPSNCGPATPPTSVPPTPPTSTPPTSASPSVSPSTLPSSEPSTSPSVEPSTVPSPSASPTPTPQPMPGVPEGYYISDCDSMTVGVKNPADGETIVINLKPSTGEATTLTVEPGKTQEESFDATPGFTVTATVEGIEGSEVLKYERPAGCAGGTGAGSGGGPVLAQTGAAAGTIAGGAAALLAIGALVFFMARRRKVKFTA